MQKNGTYGQRAQTQSRVARERIPLDERAAYSPAEFAALFGRSPTWGYRQIYAARIKSISDCGRLLIPRTRSIRCCRGKPSITPQPSEAQNDERRFLLHVRATGALSSGNLRQ